MTDTKSYYTHSGQFDWELLTLNATASLKHAYAPYSKHPVGAAGVSSDGTLFRGCNVENAAYSPTLCAECVLIGSAVCSGQTIDAIVVVTKGSRLISPCGRCRSVLLEHNPKMLIKLDAGLYTPEQLLPQAFVLKT